MGHGAVWPLGQQCLLPVPGNCEFRDGDTKQKGRPGDDGARRAGEQYPGRDACGEDMTWLTNDALLISSVAGLLSACTTHCAWRAFVSETHGPESLHGLHMLWASVVFRRTGPPKI
jgi:hypothetical protein